MIKFKDRAKENILNYIQQNGLTTAFDLEKQNLVPWWHFLKLSTIYVCLYKLEREELIVGEWITDEYPRRKGYRPASFCRVN